MRRLKKKPEIAKIVQERKQENFGHIIKHEITSKTFELLYLVLEEEKEGRSPPGRLKIPSRKIEQLGSTTQLLN